MYYMPQNEHPSRSLADGHAALLSYGQGFVVIALRVGGLPWLVRLDLGGEVWNFLHLPNKLHGAPGGVT